ncbi:hypothetical protein HK098_006148 [Nowakowskiella sp. JEL0407]|nr:hypothetical protein HK098_006148 [Nowakowskiella sp. JEL0407]
MEEFSNLVFRLQQCNASEIKAQLSQWPEKYLMQAAKILNDKVNEEICLSEDDSECTLTSPPTPTHIPENNLIPFAKPSLTLVGAGPGHPSLLTLAALDAIQSANVIVSDRLIHPQMLTFIKSINPNATVTLSRKPIPHLQNTSPEKISASTAQSEIYSSCLSALSKGLSVVRLKNGDPFVFGRGGEEVLFFEQQGYEVSVIPGISSAFAAALSARIPVTHRGVADQVVVATGWRRDEDDDLIHLGSNNGSHANKMYAPKSDPAQALPTYAPNRTVVLLMAISKLDKLTGHMLLPIENGGLGYPSDLPAAIIEKATWGSENEKGSESQHVVRGTLGEIAQLSVANGVKHHATVVVGNVVSVLN